MRQSPIHAMEREEFLSIAELMGLGLKGEELDALVHHKLLAPLGAAEGGEGQRFCALHLYVLAQYDEHVRPPQHPWRARPLADLATIKLLAARVTQLAEQLRGEGEPPRPAELEDLVVEMERYLAGIDPFGPLGDILDLLRPDVMARLRGVGRRYVELRRVAASLAELAEQYEAREVAEPMTRPVDLEEEPELAPELLPELEPESEPDSEVEVEVEASPTVEAPRAEASATSEAVVEPSEADEIPSADEAMPQALRRTATFDAEPTRVSAPPDFGAESMQDETDAQVDVPEALVPASVSGLDVVVKADESRTLHGMPQLQIRADGLRPKDEPGMRVTAEIEALPKRPVLGQRKPQPTPPPLTSLNIGRGQPNPFQRDAAQATSPNDALRERLDALRRGEPGRADASPTREVKGEEREASMLGVESTAMSESSEVSGVGRHRIAPTPEPAAPMMQEARMEEPPDDDLDGKPTMVLSGPTAPTSPLDEMSAPADAPPSAEELAERVQRLNKLREQYIKSQDWGALAALYEDGVGLFDPAERAQIFETLSKLYEVKLKDPERAWQSLERAWHGAQDDAGRLRVLQGLERQGAKRVDAWVSWLEVELPRANVQGSVRLALQRALALGLKASGQDARAFLTFAAHLAEHPDTGVSAETLAVLESLVERGRAEELYAFYDDLLETRRSAWTGMVARRAASWAAAAGDEARAAGYWAQALQYEAPSAALTDEIESFYQERGKRSALVRLLDDAIAQRPLHVARLEHVLEQALEGELAHPEAAMDEYGGRLERDPGDVLAYERLVRFYQLHQRHAEGYAFLIKHLERVSDPARKVIVLEEMGQIAQRHLMEPGEAALHYEEALALGGQRRGLLESLARVRLEQAQWGDAEGAIDKLFDHQGRWAWTPEDAVYWGMLGALASQRLGRDERRRRYLEQVLSASPEHRDARAALEAMGG